MGDRLGISFYNRAFSSLKNKNYRFYYGGVLGEMASMNMQMVSNSLLIYRLTGSAAVLGIMSLAHAVPMLLFSLFGGAVADRVQKKYIMLMEQACSAAIALAIALALTLGYLSPEHTGSWWLLVVASSLRGAIMGFGMPSRQSIIREIVSGEQLMNAVALNTLAMNTLRFIAPGVAGFLIDSLDFKAVYYAMTVMHFMSIVFTTFLPRTGTTANRRSALSDIKAGLKYIRHESIILPVLLFTLFVAILSMPYMLLLPVFTEDILKVGAKGLGILQSISGIGAAIGSLILASLTNKKRGVMLLASGLILGLTLTGFSFSGSWYPSLAFLVFVGLGQAGQHALSSTLLQYYVENEYRGRVMSIHIMQFGITSFGTFAAAMLVDSIGIQWAVGGFAIVLVFLSILVLAFVPRLRNLD